MRAVVSKIVGMLCPKGLFFLAVCAAIVPFTSVGAEWDVQSDTWSATDDLRRRLPMAPECAASRPGKTVGMFYFLWHGAHVQGGPYDISRILKLDPDAMQKGKSPLWGPLHAPHHWGESIFGYYRTADAAVLRRHAQMLSDAGVDFVVFDVTNQVTYREDYLALLREWDALRQLGNRVPRVAFLTPFWDPTRVVNELWRDLYSTGRFRELWFEWEGKPLLLADPDLVEDRELNADQNQPVELLPGHTLGQSFEVQRSLKAVGGRFPTWRGRDSAITLTLHRDGPGGERLASERFHGIQDNSWVQLNLREPVGPGKYYLEATEPGGKIGWWSHDEDRFPRGKAFADGVSASGDRTLRWTFADGIGAQIREFFTYRKPQPDYFQGQTAPDMWSWLEVFPQHVFTNRMGQREQMSVGVAQNAVKGRLGSMSEVGAHGRSFHGGSIDRSPMAVHHGYNFGEQWAHARSQDPQVIFVTGWNEWIAGRFNEFNGVRNPVMFVDQFDHEHSRDIEPMKGGHGDTYYYQLISEVRRFKGVRTVAPLVSKSIRIDGKFQDWTEVSPEYRDTLGDPMDRRHMGWDERVTYEDRTGRNDLEVAKASWSRSSAQFYARTVATLTPSSDSRWMMLFVDVDADPGTGWLGYDVVVNRSRTPDGKASVERNVGNRYDWHRVGEGQFRAAGREIELSVPWKLLGRSKPPAVLEFKWADNCEERGEWSDFTLHGDAAPNDRFNYRVWTR